MTDSDGNLSVDFLVGVTIFMMAFIWVATLVPNLFLGVSANAVDFDAVAYRTGVILAEDPGATIPSISTPWEIQPYSGKDNIERFGLAVSKETPNILSETKVNRFFNLSTPADPSVGFIYPDDYRPRTIFGDYPYRFNISLLAVGESNPRYIGEVLPDNYGYIRKQVKIKHFSNATIDKTDIQKFYLNNTGPDGNVTFHDFSIMINTTKLLNGNLTDPVINPNYKLAYQIDPRSEWINITLEDFKEKPPLPAWVVNPVKINLTQVTFSQTRYGYSGLFPLAPGVIPHKDFIYVDGSPTPVNTPVDNLDANNNITFAFKPGFFTSADTGGAIYINMTFGVETQDPTKPPGAVQGVQYLNTSKSGPWDYNYNATEVTQPVLTDAVMEVAVW
jgi:hypothetical protein